MDDNTAYRLRIIGDETVVAAMRDEPGVAVESETPAKDATLLGFDVITASAVVAIVQGALYVGELAVKLLNALKKSRSNKIVLQGPFGTLELVKDAPLTEEQVRDFLKAAQKLT